MDEKSMLEAYAANQGDDRYRLVLADYFEERGDPRGEWLRDPELARWMGPEAGNPFDKLVNNIDDEKAHALLLRYGLRSVPALLDRWPGGVEVWYDRVRREEIRRVLGEIGATVPGLPQLVERLQSTDPREQRAALLALGEMREAAGPAVPAILRLLREDRASIREAALATLVGMGSLAEAALHAAWGETGWNSEDEFTNHRLPLALIDACARFGPRSRLVVSIVRALGTSNWHVPDRARDVLIQFGADAFEVVLAEGSQLNRGAGRVCEVLRSWSNAEHRLLEVATDRRRPSKERCCSLAVLGPQFREGCGPEHDWLLPHLTELLGDPDEKVQREAAWTLGRFGERAAPAGPALVRLLDHSSPHLLSAVLHALQDLGADSARPALPLVQPLCEHSSSPLRSSAKRFVERFTEPDDQVREIREALRSENPERRKQALSGLLARAASFPDLFDLVLGALSDPDESVRLAAISAVVRRGWPEGIDPEPLLQPVLNELLARLKAEEPKVRGKALSLLGTRTLRGRPEALSAICSALRGDEPIRRTVMSLLSEWRPLPAEAVPGLIHIVRTDPSHHGRAAAGLLLEVFPRPADFLPALRERLLMGEAGRAACDALDRLQHIPSDEEVPLLVEVLEANDHSRQYSGHAARMLARRGPSSLPYLIDRLSGDNAIWGVTALATMGSSARAALPALAAVLDHPWTFVRSAVVESIAAIGAPAEIIPLLRPAFRDRDGHVRGKVLAVCSRLGAEARPWLPELMRLVRTEEDPDELQPPNLTATLAQLARDIPELADRLREALHEPRTASRNAAAALGALDSPDPSPGGL
jgi:uncharacterized protein (TIGR02996 family)